MVWRRRARASQATAWAAREGSWDRPVTVAQNTSASRIASSGRSAAVICRSGAVG